MIDCLLLMERVYPKPTTQAMMIRLVQDYYDCPIFYMPWTREALTVHLYEPLTEQQMADAELAEAIERREQDLTGLRPEPEATESMYLNFDMGTDLVKPDVFTKQMYMRVFIRQVFQLDKGYMSLFESRARMGTMYDDAVTSVASKSRSNSLFEKEEESRGSHITLGEARILKSGSGVGVRRRCERLDGAWRAGEGDSERVRRECLEAGDGARASGRGV